MQSCPCPAVVPAGQGLVRSAALLLCRLVAELQSCLCPQACKRVAPHSALHPLLVAPAEDNRLVFGTDPQKLDGCTPTAAPFPAGGPSVRIHGVDSWGGEGVGGWGWGGRSNQFINSKVAGPEWLLWLLTPLA